MARHASIASQGSVDEPDVMRQGSNGSVSGGYASAIAKLIEELQVGDTWEEEGVTIEREER